MMYQNHIELFFDHISQKNTGFPKGIFKQDNTKERLAVYRNNAHGAFHDALATAYPISKSLLGDNTWNKIINNYAKVYSSGNVDLNYFGAEMLDWIEQYSTENPMDDLPFIADLAKLEWHVHLAQLAKDDPEFSNNDFQVLNDIPADRLVFIPSHALSLVQSNADLKHIWKNDGKSTTSSTSLSKQTFCVYRQSRFQISVKQLNDLETQVLQYSHNRIPLSIIAEHIQTDADKLTQTIYSLFSCRMLIGISETNTNANF